MKTTKALLGVLNITLDLMGRISGSWILSLLALLTLPAVVDAQFNYTTNDGTISITGYTGSGGAVSIPSTINDLAVTSIGSNAFLYLSGLSSVRIPNSVTNIGDLAFASCTSLTNITIGNNVTSIGNLAFAGCTSLKNVMISDGVTNIMERVFAGCTSLTAITVGALNSDYSSVAGVLFNRSQTTLIQCPAGRTGSYSIPNSVTSIGDYAFVDCYDLRGVYFRGNAPSLGSFVFAGDTNATVYYRPGATGWDTTFGGLPTVLLQYTYTINNGTISITRYTGSNSVVTIPKAINGLPVTSIGLFQIRDVLYGAFQYSSVTSVTIPDSVMSIEQEVFYSCTSLTNVRIPASVTEVWDLAFGYCTSLTNVTIPDSVTSIGANAFFSCSSLANMTIPGSVTSIGSQGFNSCTSLTGVYFKGNAPSVGSCMFYDDNAATIYYLPGTSGWDTTFGGLRTALWALPNPLILNNGPGFGLQTNGFGFIISWATNILVVVEACTSLASPNWSPVSTNTLAGGSSYFSDPQWTNYPARFYRLRSP
ncbi:MAG: leucine-rich repeat domain-containing protein [Verrucomicrobia bacterium]|nr:leucine-rich repeat domain-containing protein [Verrucomicrobiota bacterium]